MTWILLNKRWTAIAILLVLLFIQTAITNHYVKKLKQADQQCLAQIQDIERKQVKALAEAQNEFNQVSADYEKLKSEQRTKVEYVEREVQKIIERPIYLNRCIDDDGVYQINSLIEAKRTS
ncbi:hypothetical protein JI819_002983 [Acinetobacter baumannii]|uniref:hypothetical protein n=1 Tax=Acinetobacter baumannii TaxID=470 RepID=UPI000A34780A|nr:hypothetical protein [Acinetobacter baumannii]AWS04419.1 hypothetical protein CCO27_17960 [Acinetobacter baumannii]EKV0753329.1 hypothetical protein [Acinetobacter baumannii]EKX5426676.1 hypothetical protein [Acinetobacter baumannii]EKX7522665.1 hypothetical protein [Acinetobacter baumannii]EKX9629864.1 hypothetical protein [Acinetobacter baumannii]